MEVRGKEVRGMEVIWEGSMREGSKREVSKREGSKRYLEMYRMCDLKREKKSREKAGRNEEN